MDTFWQVAEALVPSIGVGVIFYIAMRFIIRADRNERANLAELDRIESTDGGTDGREPASRGL
ncbi:hypothetical protein [Sanguibacter antarcticus]|uniref:Uncharacterized protein n=1 Tax=Sanguibacter antarcticus TaxID=372484 RepID=A0A2A9E9N4_9MICO|nr:hypothetical protein [Sanguibacter antarcticus]PFG35261.1 hypothetical protein ATL42_3203 [Sanguibacter antarcticus]